MDRSIGSGAFGAILLTVLLVGGCTSPPPSRTATPARLSAGLSLDQRAALIALRAPVVVPIAPRFDLTDFEVESTPSPYYRLSYRNPTDGTCFDVTGAAGGFGGPAYPIVSLQVTLRHLPNRGPFRLYEAADDPLSTSAQNWGPGTVLSEEIVLDGMVVTFGSSDARPGCRPLRLRPAAALFASFRLLSDL